MAGTPQSKTGRPWWPSTRTGRWAIGFASVALVAIVILQAVVIARQTPAAEDRIGDLAERFGPVVGVLFAASGLGALVASALAIFRAGDRAIAVRVALAYGLLVLLFLVGEFAVAH